MFERTVIELILLTGKVADAHSIVIISQILEMNSSNNCRSNEEYRNHLQKPCFIAVGSPNLKNALKVLAITLAQVLKDENQTVIPLVYNFNYSIFFFCKARMMEEDVLRACRRMFEMKVQLTSQIFTHLMCGYSSLGMHR